MASSRPSASICSGVERGSVAASSGSNSNHPTVAAADRSPVGSSPLPVAASAATAATAAAASPALTLDRVIGQVRYYPSVTTGG